MAQRRLDINNLPKNNITRPNTDSVQPLNLSGQPIVRKPNDFATTVQTLGNGLFARVILPTVKSVVMDFVNGIVEHMLYGADRGLRNQQSGFGHTPYNRMHVGTQMQFVQQPTGWPPTGQYPRSIHEMILNYVYFPTSQDAERVLGSLMERIAMYGWATVGDYYQLSGVQSNPSNELYGWRSLNNVFANYVQGSGWLLSLPTPSHLNLQ